MPAADLEAVVEQFEQRYRELYGPESGFRAAGIEITGFTCRGSYQRTSIDLRMLELDHVELEPTTRRAVHWVDVGETVDTPVYRWPSPSAGAAVAGPAIIELAETTIVVPSDFRASSDAFTNLLLTKAEL